MATSSPGTTPEQVTFEASGNFLIAFRMASIFVFIPSVGPGNLITKIWSVFTPKDWRRM